MSDLEEFCALLETNPSVINDVTDLQFLVELLKYKPELDEFLTPAKVIELSKYLDPYNNLNVNGDDKYLLFSYTNYMYEVIQKMNMLGMIAFLNQSVSEWGLKPTDTAIKECPEMEGKRAVVKEFLDFLFKFDPNRHVRTCYNAFKDKEMNMQNKKFLVPENVKEELHSILDLPSADIFSGYDRFFNFYYNELAGLTYHIFGTTSKIDFMINPYVAGSKEEIERFEKENSSDLRIKTFCVKMGSWTVLAPYRQNSANVSFRLDTDQAKTLDINRMMRTPNNEKLRNEMIRLKTENIKKERPLNEEDKEALKRYGENMGISDIIEASTQTQNVDLPDDALEYNVLVIDAATGNTTEGALHLKDRVDFN